MANIRYIKGDVTEAFEKVILQGCNAQGVMGSGVAKAIRDKYQNVYFDYRTEHEVNGLALGAIYPVFGRDAQNVPRHIIINGITQEYYGRDPYMVYVCYNAINRVLHRTEAFLRDLDITDIAMPKIGAGLGNGNWDKIEESIKEILVNRDINVWVYVP